jgi:hypothetical protein
MLTKKLVGEVIRSRLRWSINVPKRNYIPDINDIEITCDTIYSVDRYDAYEIRVGAYGRDEDEAARRISDHLYGDIRDKLIAALRDLKHGSKVAAIGDIEEILLSIGDDSLKI